MAADKIGERRGAALVGNVGELDGRHMGEQLGAEMDAAADAGGGVIELAGLALGERDQLGDAFRRHRGIDQDRQRAGGDQADGGKILARIVTDIRVERGIDRERAGAAEAERVAVGLRARDLAGRDAAAGAAAILDHDLLAERRAHPVGDDARHGVVAAARRVGNDQGDRAGRIVLRKRGRGERDRRQGKRPTGGPASGHRHAFTVPASSRSIWRASTIWFPRHRCRRRSLPACSARARRPRWRAACAPRRSRARH